MARSYLSETTQVEEVNGVYYITLTFTGNEYLYGTRENDDQMTYELDEKDLTYTLKTEEGQKLKIKP